jgi:hypothetical protein
MQDGQLQEEFSPAFYSHGFSIDAERRAGLDGVGGSRDRGKSLSEPPIVPFPFCYVVP